MLVLRHILGEAEQSYAEVALKASRGLETITMHTTNRRKHTKAVMLSSLVASDFSACSIQIDVMSMATPMATMTADANLSMRLSEKYPTLLAS